MYLEIKNTMLYLNLREELKKNNNYSGSDFFDEPSEHELKLYNLAKKEIKEFKDLKLSFIFIFENRFEFYSMFKKDCIVINK